MYCNYQVLASTSSLRILSGQSFSAHIHLLMASSAFGGADARVLLSSVICTLSVPYSVVLYTV